MTPKFGEVSKILFYFSKHKKCITQAYDVFIITLASDNFGKRNNKNLMKNIRV